MSYFIWFLFWIVIAIGILKLYLKITTGWCRSNVCLVGKTAIVTGANTGIGYQSAEDFAKRGAKVILACRDENRGKDAKDRIIKATDNKNVFFKQLDLSSLKSVKQFAQEINKSEERLDILLNNAGAAYLGQSKNEDGFLLVMAANYFGHFLLTNLLLDLLKKTSNSRVVNVSSRAAKFVQPLNVNGLNRFPEGALAEREIYARSKLCNILFTIELAKKLKGTSVTTYSLHPGLIDTDVFRGLPPLAKLALMAILGYLMKDSVEGAQTSIYCSVTKGIESLSGEHFQDCHLRSRYKSADDPNLPAKLWKESAKLDTVEGAQTSIHCSVAKGIESHSGEHFEDCKLVSRYKPANNPDLAAKLWIESVKLVKLNS